MSLSPEFMKTLTDGHLDDLRKLVAADSSLLPGIRKDTLSVYYRGGRLLKLERKDGAFLATFDDKYLRRPASLKFPLEPWINEIKGLPQSIDSKKDATGFLRRLPAVKATMDGWFAHHPKPEWECLQLLVRDNNRRHGRSTDFFVCDTERVESFKHNEGRRRLRFDFVAVHWPSTGADRKKTTGRGLVLGEVKRGDGAATGSSGILEHFDDLGSFLANAGSLSALKEAMKTHFNQQRQLGFIDNQNDIGSFDDGSRRPTWLLVIADHDPEKSRLKEAVDELAGLKDLPVNIRIATASFMGYGLFDQAIHSVGEFRKRYRNCIYDTNLDG